MKAVFSSADRQNLRGKSAYPANALHALRLFLQGGSRRFACITLLFAGGLTPPPCTPGGATGTFVLLACTRFMAFGWLDSCGAILHPASAFYGESRALYCATTAASGGSLPRNPLAPQLHFVASLGDCGNFWEFLGAVCIRFDCRRVTPYVHKVHKVHFWRSTPTTPVRVCKKKRFIPLKMSEFGKIYQLPPVETGDTVTFTAVIESEIFADR